MAPPQPVRQMSEQPVSPRLVRWEPLRAALLRVRRLCRQPRLSQRSRARGQSRSRVASAAPCRDLLPLRDPSRVSRCRQILRIGLFHRPYRLPAGPRNSLPGRCLFREPADRPAASATGQGLGNITVEQVKDLLDRGIEYANANGLIFGQPLTKAQIAGLKTSKYETQVLNGIEVLAPVVYVAKAEKAKMVAAGALISGGTVNVNAGSINNSGALAASTGLQVSGTSIKANGGSFVSGGDVSIAASGNLTLTAQTITVGGQEGGQSKRHRRCRRQRQPHRRAQAHSRARR